MRTWRRLIDLLPNNVIETFIRARAPRNPNDRVPLEQVNLSTAATPGSWPAQFADMLSWFQADTRSLRVENQFDFVGDLNQKERHQAHWKYLNTQIDAAGRRGSRRFLVPARWTSSWT